MNMSCKSETIVIVDDEQEIADLLEVYLKNESYVVRKFYNPLDALACIEKEPVSLAILDVMMPEIDGFSLCQKIRQKHLFPIIMLTAKIADIDKIQGLVLIYFMYQDKGNFLLLGGMQNEKANDILFYHPL